jgi:hypothetical protein
MSIDKAQLKAMAEAASKVPDWYSPQSFGLSRVTGDAERDFIGAAGPATILALLAEIERLKAGVESDWAEIERIQLLYSEQFRKARALRIERDQLKTDNEAWRLTVEAERRIKRGISDENEALRKDAERYRWLRDGAGYCDTRDIPGMAPARMDAFIDAALAKERGQ